MTNLTRLKENFLKLIRALAIQWIIFWFLLIPMRFLLINSEHNISDSNINLLIEVVALLLGIFIASFVYSSLPKNAQEKKKRENSQKIVYIIIEIERIRYFENSKEFSEEEYPSDYEDDLFMDCPRYPFEDVDLNIKRINGFDTRGPMKNWSLGKVYSIEYENLDGQGENINGEIVWVWVQIHFYNPMAMSTTFIIRCRLSEDLRAHPISEGDFVLLEYDAKRDDKDFKNRDFTIIQIEKNKE